MSKQTHLTAITNYGLAWAERDAAKRLELLTRCWDNNGLFEDPLDSVRGRQAFSDHIGHFQEKWPDAVFLLTSPVSIHHQRHHFAWQMKANGGAVVLNATNVGLVNASGQLLEMVDFFHE